MKIVPTSKISHGVSYSQNNLSVPQQSFTHKAIKDSVSFGSLGANVVDALKNNATGVFRYIENAGFFMEFLIVDTLSMIVPRVLVGLNRDRNKTGQYNIKAGAEEAGREILSGPTMNLIPMGLLAIANSFNPAVRMEKGNLENLTQNAIKIIQESKDTKSLDKMDETLARQLFKQYFEQIPDDNGKLQQEFVNLLTSSADKKPKSWIKKIFGSKDDPFAAAATEFEKFIVKINNQHSADKAPVNPSLLSTKGGKTGSKELFEDFYAYSKDILKKLAKKGNAADNLSVDKLVENLTKAKNARVLMKAVTAFTAFFAVGEFLLHLPKIYQLSKISPAKESAKRAISEFEKQGGANENS